MPCKDKEKQKIHARNHYLRNKEKIKARAKAFTKNSIKRNYKLINDYLSTHPCIDCGECDRSYP